ncbi:hypothetical protein L3X38_011580 [Prunus dulcis]|uniref:Uncharacterized protein n=1 Tax=Prunus dulcis TaxID=3755 RepID=A0AAD4ZF94_PRUDU|nr:hypothetical protein L3X38_011580 [Prunus dulcis]
MEVNCRLLIFSIKQASSIEVPMSLKSIAFYLRRLESTVDFIGHLNTLQEVTVDYQLGDVAEVDDGIGGLQVFDQSPHCRSL